ncbi:MAG: ABC transporter ATP-binding protein, partial [Candidatus Methanofastidiosia archaeon]
EVKALKNINLEIYEGEIFGLLGPNGAGKTTLIKCLTTLLLPTEGTAWINDFNLQKNENMVRASIGCMLMGERGLYWKLTGKENLEFFSSLYHVPPFRRGKKVSELIELLDLNEIIDRTVETYSSGQKMKLAFAKSLITEAPILILDEPTVTMDVHSARELRGIVKDLNEKGHTVIYTTHQMDEAEELCSRVAIIDRGKIIALGTVKDLKSQISKEDVTKIEGIIPDKAFEILKRMGGIKNVAITKEDGVSKLVIVSENSRIMLPKVIRVLFEYGSTIEYISPEDVTLEDIFIAKTGRTLSEDTRVI